MPIKPENKKLYPKNWKEISSKIRVNRANNRCEICKVENHSHVFRGFFNDIPVYQYGDGYCYSALDGKIMGGRYLADLEGKVTYVYIVLTVGHLDHNPQNNEESNLRCMCQKCHNNYDRKHRNQTMKQTRNKGQLALNSKLLTWPITI